MPSEHTLDETTVGDSPGSSWVPSVGFLSGPRQGQRYHVRGKIFTIGRSSRNDISIADKASSRRHAVIEIEGGRYVLKDLESRWGTTVNGQQVKEHALKFGDEIGIAAARLRFDLVPADSLAAARPRWERKLLAALAIVAAASIAAFLYVRHEQRKIMDQPGGDALAQIIYHYDRGIGHYNEMEKGDRDAARRKAIEEMEQVIALDPEGRTRFSKSARRIIDGLER